jgi:hypothetical protein
VADLAVLHEVLRADGAEPVAFVAASDVEGWISAIGKMINKAIDKAPTSAPAPRPNAAFARAIARKYSRQRMTESYLSLFEAQRRRLERPDVTGLQPATEKGQP